MASDSCLDCQKSNNGWGPPNFTLALKIRGPAGDKIACPTESAAVLVSDYFTVNGTEAMWFSHSN
jgi:hypothetical protein